MTTLLRAYRFPLGLAGVSLLALSFPAPGAALYQFEWGGVAPLYLLVAVIFLISGWNLQPVRMGGLPPFLKRLLLVLAIHGVLWPLAAILAHPVLTHFPAFSTGILVLALAPTTLASAVVMTRQAGGNESLAVGLTVSLSFLAVFTAPWGLRWLGSGDAIGIDPLPLLRSLLIAVGLPLLIGYFIRSAVPSPVQALPSLCILAIVWLSASYQQPGLVQIPLAEVGSATVIALLLHLAFFGISRLAASLAHLNRPDQIAVSLIGSQKTLPFSLLLVAALPMDNDSIALAVAFCILYHLIQIMIDSWLVIRWKRKNHDPGCC